MIFDDLKNASLYHAIAPALKSAFDYLRQTDFSRVPDGRYALDSDNVFAIVQRYPTKLPEAAMWEAHRKYADVQYVAEGIERIGYAPLRQDSKIAKAYDADKDVVFFEVQGDFISVSSGQFVVFWPHDIHAPCLMAAGSDRPQNVCKVVVKCRVAE